MHLLVMKLKISHTQGPLGSAVWYSPARSAIAVYYSPHDLVMRAIICNGISTKISTAHLSGKRCEKDAVGHLLEDCESFHQFYTLNIKASFSKALQKDGAVIIMPLYIVDSWES